MYLVLDLLEDRFIEVDEAELAKYDANEGYLVYGSLPEQKAEVEPSFDPDMLPF
jgi:hypothetical protein